MKDWDWVAAIPFAALAAFGGVMGYIVRTTHENKPLTFARILIEGGGAGFVGLLVVMLCNYLNFPEQITGVTAGVMGWLGAQYSIGVLERVVVPRLGGKVEPKD